MGHWTSWADYEEALAQFLAEWLVSEWDREQLGQDDLDEHNQDLPLEAPPVGGENGQEHES